MDPNKNISINMIILYWERESRSLTEDQTPVTWINSTINNFLAFKMSFYF